MKCKHCQQDQASNVSSCENCGKSIAVMDTKQNKAQNSGFKKFIVIFSILLVVVIAVGLYFSMKILSTDEALLDITKLTTKLN